MPVVKPVRKGAKLANTTEFTAEAAEDIRVGDSITVGYRFGETLKCSFSTVSKVLCAAYTLDGKRLFVGTNESPEITVYDCSDYSQVSSFTIDGLPYAIAFKPNSSHAAILVNGYHNPAGEMYDGSRHNTVCVYDANTFELLWWYDLGQSEAVSNGSHGVAQYSSTGRYLLTSSYQSYQSGELKVFTTSALPYTETEAPVGYQVSAPVVRGAAYNHDDSMLALAYNGYVGLYDNTGAYPREVAFSSDAPFVSSGQSWTLFEYSSDESRLCLAEQSTSGSAYVYIYDVTSSSIVVLKKGTQVPIHYNTNGSVCAVTPDSYRVMTATATGFARWKPHQVYDVSAALPLSIDLPELPEPHMTTDMISYLLFEPDGSGFVFFGCTADDSSALGTAYVYSCKKYVCKATLNNSKQAVGVGYAINSAKAGEVCTVALFY